MKSLFLLFATVAMAVADDADTVIQAISMRMASNSFIVCSDQSSTCPSGTTCCKLIDGGNGCCKYPDATCCSDYKHCCPSDYRCDLGNGKCVKAFSNNTLPWMKKERASSLAFEAPARVNTICPGGGYCAVRASCCRTYTGSYNCCNYPYNVCCNGVYCCHSGYICDLTVRRCIPGFVASPWQKLTAAEATQSQPAL